MGTVLDPDGDFLDDPDIDVILDPSGPESTLRVDVAGAVRGPVVGGPRISRPGELHPPITATVYRLRQPVDSSGRPVMDPVVTLDQSFERTWQEQYGDAGSGSLKLMNDDPDLALIRDGDRVIMSLYGEAAFCWVVADREKVTIASGEEHDEATTLSGPGLLSWLTSSMLVYPARRPPNEIYGPLPERNIQGEPVEENRLFSWVAYDSSLIAGGPFPAPVTVGAMPDKTDEDWPALFAGSEKIWAATSGPGVCYFRNRFETSAQYVEGYFYCEDQFKVYVDGQLVIDSDGTPDAGTVFSFSEPTAPIGTAEHSIAVAVNHQTGRPVGFAAVVYEINDDGDITVPLFTADTGDWWVLAYPPTPPPVTAGSVVLSVLAEMNGRRHNPQMQAYWFNGEHDTDGNPWPLLPEITTKVGNDIFTFLKEISEFVEWEMRWNPNELSLWVPGRRRSERTVVHHGPTDPHDPNSANLKGLTHRRTT